MRWQILGKIDSEKPPARREKIVQLLLKSRGLKTKKQQEKFFSPPKPESLTLREVGLSLAEIKKAALRIKKAIKDREKIIVYGDYDADGVCATAIVWEALDRLGADAMPFVPSREEGYGLKVARINKIAESGVKLIITVDQGIVHARQIKHAQKIGVDVIVTDHHVEGKKLPSALAVVHTTRLAGAGVAWLFTREIGGGTTGLDLATIGTVTDMVPLLGPNRSIVKHGLKSLRKTKRLGLQALSDFAVIDRKKIGMYEVGYIIGPRINAAGRMDDPMESLRLVCTRDENRAISLAQDINQRNRERQDLTKQTTKHARELWLEQDGQSALIFVYHEKWEHGVIGLVASRLKDEFSRPAVVLGPRADHWVASARSIEGFSIVNAIRELKSIIGDHGGHKLAAGFSVDSDKLNEVGQKLVEKAEAKLDRSKMTAHLKIDAEIDLSDANFLLHQQLVKFEPFGQANPQPVFATRRVKVLDCRAVGKDNQHLKLKVAPTPTTHPRLTTYNSPPSPIDAIAFGFGHLLPKLASNQSVDIAYNLMINEWNGQKNLQLKIKDLKIR